jgi:D-tyrosyl-tRNA(Tyr) deacylase
VGEIGPGLCVLVGVTHGDDDATARRMAEKLWQLRVFDDERGVMNVSAADAGLPLLVVSQFTLYGDTRRGRRPSWAAAAPPEVAEPLVDALLTTLRGLGAETATGRFGAHMQVELVNDGPVTLVADV